MSTPWSECPPLANALAGPEPLTLAQLQTALDGASPATTFRFLRKVPHLRSYNHNGGFYTHADPARLDDYGLLSLGTVLFSRDRSLTATVIPLVREADAGWTHKELHSLLHVSCQAYLRSAVRRGKIRRAAHMGSSCTSPTTLPSPSGSARHVGPTVSRPAHSTPPW